MEGIKGGAFVKEWSEEQAAGSKILTKIKEQALHGRISEAEKTVIRLVRRAHEM